MRLLKENYEGLHEFAELPEYLKRLLSDPNNQELFKNNDFKTLYSRLDYNSSGLTEVLNSLDIDPLKYLDHIPGYFLAYTSIESINIPDNIKRIGSNAFNNCTSLTSITIPNSVESIGDYAFYNCASLTSIVIPDSVTTIGDYAFYYCSSLTSATIGNGVTSISDSAFFGCRGLMSITIPNSVTSISDWVFSDCTGLTNVTIGNRVTRIGYMAFEGCRNLNYIKYMGTIDQWNKIHISSDWNGLSSIKTIHCADGDITL